MAATDSNGNPIPDPVQPAAEPAPAPEAAAPVVDVGAAVLAGVEQAVAAAVPAVAAAAVVSNPNAAAVVTAVTALEPFLAAAVQAQKSGVLTQAQLDQLTVQAGANVQATHTAWLAAVAGHPGV